METSAQLGESCDCISDLPDNLLHHVLSFLPIKDVIRTSFISRRWRSLWTCVPILNFDGLVFSPKTKFIHFVDSVLSRRDNCAIQKFCLRFGDYYCTSDRVHAWVLAAIAHNVSELSLASYALKSFKLPQHFFTCKSLTVLTLNLNHYTLNLPSTIHLPLLNTLQLISLTFVDGNLHRFFSNCPLLENVLIEDCELSDSNVFHISSTSVQRLIIDCFPKELSIHGRVPGSEVRVSMPKLSSFEYKDRPPQKISLGKMSSLTNASIDTGFNGGGFGLHGRRGFTNVIDILGCLSNAEVLKLSLASIELLSVFSSFSMACLPVFSKLKRLMLSVEVNSDSIRLVTCFLDISPSLELLSVELSHRPQRFCKMDGVFEPQDSGCEVDDFKIINTRCLMEDSESYHLKIINIRGFIGKKEEVVFVKYLLEHACNLERITIVSSKHFSASLERKMKIEEDILMHRRGSVSSEILFESTH